MVNSCEPYWKLQCIRSGIFQDLDLLQKEMITFGSFKSLFLAFLKFKERFRPALLILEEAKVSNSQCTPILNGFYYSCPTTMNASVSVFNHSLRCSKQTVSSTVENVFARGYPSILWSSSSDNAALLCTNNGRWLKFHFLTDIARSLSACFWEENCIRSFIHCVAGSCAKCCLVVIIKKRRNVESLWELETLQFRTGHQDVIAVTVKFRFFPNELDSSHMLEAQQGLDPFCVQSVSIIPLRQQSSSDCCSYYQDHDHCELTKHQLLVQFGFAVVVFELSTSNSRCIVSSPLRVWCPNRVADDFLYESTTQCLLSKDHTIIALCKSTNVAEINVWNTRNEKENILPIPNYPGKVKSKKLTKCLAVGRVFTVVAKYIGGCLPNIYIMSTDGGCVVCECDLNAIKSPVVSKITSCYFQMIVVRELTEQHQKLLSALELGTDRSWIDTLAHSGVHHLDVCVVPCVSTCETNVIMVKF